MTTAFSAILGLFTELGPSLASIDYVVFNEDEQAWSIRFDDGSDIWAEWDEDLARLVVEAPLAAPLEPHKAAVHEAALAYNTLWRATGAGLIGLADATGELLLMVDVPAQDLDLDQLQHVVLQVKAVAADWNRLIAEPASADPMAPADLRLQGMRV